MRPLVTSPAAWHRHGIRCVLLGALLGVGMAATVTHWATRATADVTDPRMEQACNWPRGEGEMTVVTVFKGEVVCWRWN